MADTGIGRIIDNKYEILTSIGRGGMSYVWLGRDKRLDKMWAIKEFRPSTISSQGAANRQAIIDEANFIKRLDHPAIPRVVDIIDTGASIFVVMDFIDGTALNKVLRQQGEAFEQERVIEWGIELCDVLEYLHGLKNPVVYRDMKPSNIMLRGDDTVKLIDFGISMELLPSGPSDTRVIGTGGYGAPEQVDKEVHKMVAVDTRADIYALGATLYSLVTNDVPHARKDEMGRPVVDFNMVPIREWNGQLSEGLEHIIEKATQPDPRDRYQTAAEMRYDLEHYEELTREYRAVQQKKVDGFRNRLIAAGISFVVGILCLGVSFLVRSTSYGALVHEASVASTSERNEVIDETAGSRTAEASEAEELYTQAIAVDPGNIETYLDLVNLYESDNLFTATEARRWVTVWQAHGRDIEGNERYGELCYNVGILYLVYYDYADAVSIKGKDKDVAATGQAAVENATQSIRWFNLALQNPGSLKPEQLDAAERYVTIGEFYEKVTKANREGAGGDDVKKVYGDFWTSLETMVTGKDGKEPTMANSEPIVKLRVYQVAFESVSSPTYLAGFQRAGITREQAAKMLDAVQSGVESLASFRNENEAAASAMYDEIVDGMSDARANVVRVFESTSALLADAEAEEEQA